MTWRTQIGERIIEGHEAVLLREAIAGMRDMFEEEIDGYADPWKFGVPLFDSLEPIVKLALLAEVGLALFYHSEQYPPLTAVNESAIGAIFEHIEQSVQFELDCWEDMKDCSFSWRQLLLNVMPEIGEGDDLPAADSLDADEWNIMIQVLRDRILWDDDFNDADLYLDLPADRSHSVKAFMTIDDDYFRAVPPNPRESDLPAIRQSLERIINP